MAPEGNEQDDDGDHAYELRSFGRRRGRKLSPRQDALFGELLPRVAVDLTRPVAVRNDLLAPGTSALWLEIGFGGGEHLLWQAAAHPETTLIGCEPFVEGVAKVLSAIEAEKRGNVRLHDDDVRPLLRWLPEGSIDRCFVLFPDPWPKKRHVKRRLVAEPTLASLARALRPGAELRVATDIADYARTMMIAFAATPAFRWTATCAADWRVRPADWPQTRYEAKAVAAGRARCYLRFVRE